MPVLFSDVDYLIRYAIKALIVIFQFHEYQILMLWMPLGGREM